MNCLLLRKGGGNESIDIGILYKHAQSQLSFREIHNHGKVHCNRINKFADQI